MKLQEQFELEKSLRDIFRADLQQKQKDVTKIAIDLEIDPPMMGDA